MVEATELQKRLLRTRFIAAVLFVICLTFFVFGYIKNLEAEAQTELALSQKIIAEQAKAEAERQRALAMQTEVLAQQQALLASQALEECQKIKIKK